MSLLTIVQTMIASFIFFPSHDYSALPQDFGLKSEIASVVTSDHAALAGWFLPADGAKATIYLLHGNAGNIGDRLFKAAEWVKRGCNVFLLDYRGYGQSKGTIESEDDIYRDGEAGLLWLMQQKKLLPADIILYGESIGCAAAIHLAPQQHFRALVLESPFSSLTELAKKHYPFVPEVFLNHFQFNNMGKIARIETPVFILHGEADEICPIEMGKALFQAFREPKKFLSIPGGSHNNLPIIAGSQFYDQPLQFALEQGGKPL